MKKALVLLLALAMVLPMALAMPANAEVEKEPFYTLGWSEFDATKYPYLDGLYKLNWGNLGGTVKLSGLTYSEDDPAAMEAQAEALAKTVKADMDKRPAGARYIHTFGPASMYRLAPEDALFMDYSVDQMKVIMDVFLKKYQQIGGQLDGIVVDVEYIGLSTYYLIDTNGEDQPNNYLANPNLLKDIVKNPKYATEIRPLLEEYGFLFYDAGDPVKQASYTELYSITKNAGSKYSNSRSIWNTVTRIHLNRYVTEWAYEPLMKYFPEANVSDYQSTDTDSWLRLSSVTDDGTEMTGGNSIKAGDTSTYSFYYGQPGDMYDALKKYTGYNDAFMPKNNFTQLKYYVNYGKYMYESTDTHKIAPWITYYDYGSNYAHRISNSPYYTEQIYHLGLLDPQPFLAYTYKGDKVFKQEGVSNTESTHYHEVQKVHNEVMEELTRVAGYSDREPIMTPMDWNSEYMLSGMYTGGRNLWRITPNIHMVSLENFKVDAKDPTFTIEGKTVTFPGGKIIADGTVSIVGSCGYWVETAKDVMPVVTTEEDRYEKYPSLLYNFEDYKEGAFDYNTSQPKGAWNFTWKKFGDIKGESKIVTVDGNKKVSIIGNSYNAIKEMSNITAGDNYAKNQTWELTVTIPEGMNADAQINILTYKGNKGNKQEIEDGGFMVKGGKLYYATGKETEDYEPEYEELMDIAPGTYKFKRVMNFHFMDTANYSTFIVCDAAGKELKKVENVASPKFNYINEIGFSVTDAGKAVIVDDFKIYVTGIATDFGLYDAVSGQIVKDADMGTARNRSTAYRLSWLNATNEDQTATIKADITAGGKTETKVIKEVKLQAGNDSVVTGIVDIQEGETVKVYLETSVKAPEDPAKPTEPEATDPTVAPTDAPEQTQAPEATDAPEQTQAPEATEASKAPTAVTVPGRRPTAVKVSRPTVEEEIPDEPYEPEEPVADPTEEPTEEVEEPVVEPTEEVEEPVVEPTEETEAPTEETEAPITEETEEPTEEPTEPAETKGTEATKATTPVEDKDEGGANVGLIITIVVVVLAAAGAGVYFFIFKKKAAK